MSGYPARTSSSSPATRSRSSTRLTAFSRAPAVPVAGIVDEGRRPSSPGPWRRTRRRLLVLFGTRTTIGSGEHVRRLARRWASSRRASSTAACHGLAGGHRQGPGRARPCPAWSTTCVLGSPSGVSRPRAALRRPRLHPLRLRRRASSGVARPARRQRRWRSSIPTERLVDGLTGGLAPVAARRGPEAGLRSRSFPRSRSPRPNGRPWPAVSKPCPPRRRGALLDYTHSPDLF
ncbi:MAG: hypothetical protein M0C28_38045 [Candidatus Moduliflexus flocculans]|nr:hypothetical protein [Candidatus Moduliflexus flocculans]